MKYLGKLFICIMVSLLFSTFIKEFIEKNISLPYEGNDKLILIYLASNIVVLCLTDSVIWCILRVNICVVHRKQNNSNKLSIESQLKDEKSKNDILQGKLKSIIHLLLDFIQANKIKISNKEIIEKISTEFARDSNQCINAQDLKILKDRFDLVINEPIQRNSEWLNNFTDQATINNKL